MEDLNLKDACEILNRIMEYEGPDVADVPTECMLAYKCPKVCDFLHKLHNQSAVETS